MQISLGVAHSVLSAFEAAGEGWVWYVTFVEYRGDRVMLEHDREKEGIDGIALRETNCEWHIDVDSSRMSLH